MPPRSQDDAAIRAPVPGGNDAGIVVPLRSFTFGKARLAPVLSAAERVELVRSMAERVVRAAGARPVAIVTSDADVVAWGRERGCDVLGDPGSLDASASAGRAWAERLGLVRYAVVHADLPFVTSLDLLAADGDAAVAVVVPDQRDDGTPAISLPTAVPFPFAYGPGSASRHVDAARRCALDVRIVHDPEVGFDVDVAADLDALHARRRSSTP